MRGDVIIDAFVTACSLGQESVVRRRIKTWSSQGTLSHNLSLTDLEGRTAVGVACEKGHLLVLLSLIRAGASLVTPSPSTGHTPLHLACKWGRPAAVRALLDAGSLPTLNSPDNSGNTPLHMCANYGHPECMKMLCGHMADPYECNESMRTPLGCGMQSRILRRRENEMLFKYTMEVFRVK
ncbi:hypothetical protein TrRE_jg9304, partial [Triparma retinervis]